jgi:tetratricopeptide (TPR) repeat protein
MRLFAGRHRASFAVATGLVLSVVVGRGWLLPSAAPPAAAPVAIASRLAAQASGLARRGRPEEARALYARAVRSLDATVPATDPVRLAIMDSLARTLNDLALWDEAFRVAREALNRARLTANDSLLAVARLRVALIEENIPGRLPSAEAGLREALTLLRASHPPNHALVVEATRKLAVVLSVQGHTPTALAVLDSAIARNTARGNLPDAAYLTGQRVPILLRAGRPREAQRSAEVARTRLEELPEASTKRADVQLWSAMAEMQAGKFDAATEDLSAANAGYQRRYSARHPRRAMVNCALGSSLVLSERGTDGDSLIQDACPRYEEWSLAHPSIDRWRRKAARKLQRVQ